MFLIFFPNSKHEFEIHVYPGLMLFIRYHNIFSQGRRGSRGRNGRGRGEERAYPRVRRTKAFNNKNQKIAPSNNDNTINNQNNALDKQSNAVNYQKNTPKGERGIGPRRYQPTWKKH